MKFAIVAILCLAVAESKVIEPRRSFGANFEKFAEENDGAELYANINDDVQEFVDLFPKAQIKAIAQKYLKNDAEVQSNFKYLTSDAVEKQIFAIEKSAEFKKVRAQLEGGNLDVARFINMLHDMLGFDHMTRQMRAGSGLGGMLNEIKPIIPMSKIKALAAKKFIFSSAFRKMVNIIKSPEFLANGADFASSGLVKALGADAVAHGVDFQAIVDFIRGLVPIYKSLIVEDYDY